MLQSGPAMLQTRCTVKTFGMVLTNLNAIFKLSLNLSGSEGLPRDSLISKAYHGPSRHIQAEPSGLIKPWQYP